MAPVITRPAAAPAPALATGIDNALAHRVQRATASGPLNLEDATELTTFILSNGRRETKTWTDMDTLLEGLRPSPLKALQLLFSAAPPLPEQRRAQRPTPPGATIEGTHPLDDAQLRALIDTYGAPLKRDAERRLESIFARISIHGNAEDRKLRLAKRLLLHERRRARGGALGEDAARRLSTIFRIGGLTEQSRDHLQALLRDERRLQHEPISRQRADWTYFVNIDARSNLANDAIDDVQEMELVGSVPKALNVVALVTSNHYLHESNDAWRRGTRLLHIRRDESDPQRIVSVEKAIAPESALGKLLAASPKGTLEPSDPAVIRAAIEYVKAEFPSKHLAVDLWGHGTNAGEANASIGSVVHPRDLPRALSGMGVDLLTFDACDMGTYEAASAATEAGAKRFVASQYPVVGEGFSYDRLLGRASQLTRGERVMSGEELGRELVDQYLRDATAQRRRPIESMASVDLTRFPRVREKVDQLARAMIDAGGLAQGSPLAESFKRARRPRPDELDLGDLARVLGEDHPGPIARAAKALQAELASASYVRSVEHHKADLCSPSRGACFLDEGEPRGPITALSISAPARFVERDLRTVSGPWGELLKTLPRRR